MRKYRVIYSDKTFSDRTERFETQAMDPDKAKEMAHILSLMGCTDFEYVPERKAA